MSCHNLGSFTDRGIFADEFLSFLRSRLWSFRSWSTVIYIYTFRKTWLPILVEPHPQSSNQMGEFASCSKYGFCVSCSWSRFLMFILSSGINPNDAHALFLGDFLRHGENRKEKIQAHRWNQVNKNAEANRCWCFELFPGIDLDTHVLRSQIRALF